MKLKNVSAVIFLLAMPVHADPSVIQTLTSYEESVDPLLDLAEEFAADPEFAGKIVNLCVNGQCIVIDRTDLTDKGGQPQVIASREWTRDVASVVKAATGGVSGSANVKVSVTHTETKKDGSSSSTKVEVDVTVQGGKK